MSFDIMSRFMDGPPSPRDVSQLIVSRRNGDKAALDEMSEVSYKELRRLALYVLSAQNPNHTLQSTGMAHEACLRLVSQRGVDWRNRAASSESPRA